LTLERTIENHENLLSYMHEVTLILNSIERGDAEAAEELLAVVHEELRRMAAPKFSREKPFAVLLVPFFCTPIFFCGWYNPP